MSEDGSETLERDALRARVAELEEQVSRARSALEERRKLAGPPSAEIAPVAKRPLHVSDVIHLIITALMVAVVVAVLALR